MESPGGHIEVDPWSLPPPEDGYENLVIDDGRPATAAAAAAPDKPKPVLPRPSAPPPPAATAADVEDETPSLSDRLRSPAVLAAAAAAVLLVAGAVVWMLSGPSTESSAPGATVRVTVTQEAPWASPPPLAPVDPSFQEPARPETARPDTSPEPVREPPARRAAAAPPSRATPVAPAARAPGPGAAEAPRAAAPDVAAAPDAPALGTVTPAAPPPDTVSDAAPAPASPPATAVPLPPAPEVGGVQAVPAVAGRPAGKGRGPVLQTSSCVENALRVPRGLEGRLPREVVMRVEVGEDGRPTDVSLPSGVDSRLGSALVSAVRTCRFAPGADPSGRPAASPTTMRVRFDP